MLMATRPATSAAATSAVPLVDLHAQYLTIRPEVDAAIAEVIQTSSFIRGPQVEEFERAFADAIGVEHCAQRAAMMARRGGPRHLHRSGGLGRRASERVSNKRRLCCARGRGGDSQRNKRQ